MTAISAAWVMLRGLTREARHWGNFPAQLGDPVAQPVITLDLPGKATASSMHLRPLATCAA